MRLLKIGRDASCDIVLHSDKVSGIHAELTLMDSGDILLEDKGSRNGTFLMNNPVAPGKTIKVRRGDMIRFADVELQWSQVPPPEDNSMYKGIYGVGTNFNNDFQLSGSTVSRYHATIKQGKDGKMYIVDHSKNGTTVDGTKISPNNPYRIKRKSVVVCGGVPLDLSRLPWPNEYWKYLVGMVAVVALVLGIGYGAYSIIPSSQPSLQSLQNATTCVVGQYYIEVTFKDDPFIGKISGWPEKWEFGLHNKKLTLGTFTDKEIMPITYTGTAFFISENGELGTNRHIAVPWEYLTNDEINEIRQEMEKKFDERDLLLISVLSKAINNGDLSGEDAIAMMKRLQRSEYEISGRMHYMGVALAGTNFSSLNELLPCQVIAESGTSNRDVALIRLNTKATPQYIVEKGFYDITKARVNERSLKPQEEELTTIGYPAGLQIGFQISTGSGTELQPTVHKTSISRTPTDDTFQIQSNAIGGQSGSPIIDRKRNLVGVLCSGYRTTDVTYGCNIKHLKELYDKHKVE